MLGRCGLLRQTFSGCVTPACWCWGKERREKAHTFFLTYACSFLVRSCSGHRPKAGRVEKTTLFSLKLVMLIMLFFFLLCSFVARRGLYTVFFFSLVMSVLSSLLFFFYLPVLFLVRWLSHMTHETNIKKKKKCILKGAVCTLYFSISLFCPTPWG